MTVSGVVSLLAKGGSGHDSPGRVLRAVARREPRTRLVLVALPRAAGH